ncbi:MAG TPA: DUF2304 domain-containing protein [Pseudonocardia sp.]|jgi:small membrane protein|nr:DUF2304 domain-containing protein [Pseudonocardia sp.]
MLIQFLLILSVMVVLIVVARAGGAAYVQASKRVGLVAFAAANVYAVLRPADVTVVARFLGVNRGTDLVLYSLVVAFMLGMVSMYVRFRVVDRRYTELARAVAIREAESVNSRRGLRQDDTGQP